MSKKSSDIDSGCTDGGMFCTEYALAAVGAMAVVMVAEVGPASEWAGSKQGRDYSGECQS